MSIKITFHNMSHSDPMEAHANEKLEKLTELVGNSDGSHPFRIELWLKANKQHPHHAAELHLRSAHYDLNAHDEGTDMYAVIDTTIDKMVGLLKKEKRRFMDKMHKPDTEKKNFYK